MEVLDVTDALAKASEAAEITPEDLKYVNTMSKLIKAQNAFTKLLPQPQPQPQINPLILKMAQNLENRMVEQFLSNLEPKPQSSGVVSLGKDVFKTIQSITEHPESPLSQGIGNIISSLNEGFQNYRNNGNGSGNTNKLSSKEDIYKFVLSLNPSNLNDLQKFKELISQDPQNEKLEDLNDVYKALINEQMLIKKELNIPDEIQQSIQQPQQQQSIQQQQQPMRQQQPIQPQQRQRDINRHLIDQYDIPQNQNQNNAFFNNNVNPNLSISDTKQSPNEIILSLNPDDPISIHQYASMRNIFNLDAKTIKNMLIKEQEQIRKSIPQPVQSTFPSGDSWNNEDLNKPLSKPTPTSESMSTIMGTTEGDDGTTISRTEFEKEINLNQPHISNSQPEQILSQPEPKPEPSINSDISNIENLIQRLGTNLENGIEAMNKKIEFLENEVMILKSEKVANMDYSQLINSNSVMECITENVNTDIIGIENDSTIPKSNTENDSDKLKTESEITQIPSSEVGTIPSMSVPTSTPSTEIDISSITSTEAGTSSIPSTVSASPPLHHESEIKEDKETKNDWWSARHSVKDSIKEEPKQVKKFVIRRHYNQLKKEPKEESKNETTSKEVEHEEKEREVTEPVE